MSIEQNYSIVLKDLEARRQHCVEELQMLDQMIAGLRRFTARTTPNATMDLKEAPSVIPSAITEKPPTSRVFAGLSVRWAILCLLAEYAQGPLGTAEIAQALRDGGITSNAQNFNGNVSAVLSGM